MRRNLPLSFQLSLFLPSCLLYLTAYFARDSGIIFFATYRKMTLESWNLQTLDTSLVAYLSLLIMNIRSHIPYDLEAASTIRNPWTLNAVVTRKLYI
jgi:hypothetical protein